MINNNRPIPFILVSCNHGSMIINKNDFRMTEGTDGYGVGFQILNTSSFDQQEVNLALVLLEGRLRNFGAGVVAMDCGANIGVHTVEWARLMHGWGRVISFEAQERIYYALAGNVAINNCLNASLTLAAVGGQCGFIDIPEPDYLVPSSYGSLGLRERSDAEFIGQDIDYGKTKSVPLVSIDSLGLNRLDFLKIDVEGMEEEVLDGARNTIHSCRPNVLIEIIKSDRIGIADVLLRANYRLFEFGINFLGIHADDPMASRIDVVGNSLRIS